MSIAYIIDQSQEERCTVRVDLHGSPGTSIPLPTTTQSYTISAQE
jgi:hypothetical protein